MSAVTSETMFLTARNPATGAEIGRVAAADPASVASIAAEARRKGAAWAAVPIRERLRRIDAWRASIAHEAAAWADLLVQEIGKPRGEAFGELTSTLDAMRWTVRHGAKALAPQRIGAGLQTFMMIPSARLEWRPLGLVGMIGTWNYPLFLNAPAIAQALAAGNGVIWKPSELAPLCGEKLQASLERAGLGDGLVAAVQGGADVGSALVESGIDKIHFTGGVANGRRVLAAAGALGVPGIAELSGYDAAIVMPDADLDKVARPLAWAVFTAAGQACVTVKRIYVVGDPRPLAERLAALARALRVGDPARPDTDVGPLITANARDRFHGFVAAAIEAGAEPLAGGAPIEGPGNLYAPTVLLANDAGPEERLAGCFGPCVVVRGVKSADEAVEAANASEYALAASVWGRDLRSARAVGERLAAGMVWINDAVTPSAHAAAPFGGVKASGFGRTRGVIGLREFAAPRTTHVQSFLLPRVHLHPYSERLSKILATYVRLVHGR